MYMIPTTNNILWLTLEQLEMLKMSEDDIANGRLVSEEKLEKMNSENLFGNK